MPKKETLEDTIHKLEKKLLMEQKSNDLLFKQQKELRILAEEAGSQMSEFKHKYLRLLEENEKLKNEIKFNIGGKK